MSSSDGNDGGFFNGPTRRVGSGTDKTIKRSVDERPTVAVDSNAVNKTSGDSTDPNLKTRRVRPGSSVEEASVTQSASGTEYQPEFVVGWLVVIDGPGRGASRPLGYGMNPVGREEETGVRLNFGDEEISRKAHCHIAYDHKNKRFFIQHGGGQNLTYVENDPILSSSELHAGANISMGNTVLKFVQLCGNEFDWEE